jgi:hypothetical protein
LTWWEKLVCVSWILLLAIVYLKKETRGTGLLQSLDTLGREKYGDILLYRLKRAIKQVGNRAIHRKFVLEWQGLLFELMKQFSSAEQSPRKMNFPQCEREREEKEKRESSLHASAAANSRHSKKLN